jgi:NTP pyrophosphatase (non-canonical NTP hydrolase)
MMTKLKSIFDKLDILKADIDNYLNIDNIWDKECEEHHRQTRTAMFKDALFNSYDTLKSLTINEQRQDYRQMVLDTANSTYESPSLKMVNAALGLSGEAGEFADLIKKWMYHGHTYDEAAMIKELGDIRWYLEYAAICLGVSMEQIEQANIDKLKARYPSGFTTKDSIERKDR